jgi:hypothetical protein
VRAIASVSRATAVGLNLYRSGVFAIGSEGPMSRKLEQASCSSPTPSHNTDVHLIEMIE